MEGNSLSDEKYKMALVSSYFMLRRTIGFLGFVFPFLLLFGAPIYDGTGIVIESSISSYYYTGVKHIFAGVLFVVAFFLLAYKFQDDTEVSFSHCKFILCKINLSDNAVGNAACFFAIGIALFPTTEKNLNFDIVGSLHYVFAGLFFLCLIYFSLCLFTRSKSKKIKGRKRIANCIYKICGYTMFLCILLIAAIKIYLKLFGLSEPVNEEYTYVFWLEAIALWAFGISWLVKGEMEEIIIKTFKQTRQRLSFMKGTS